MAGKAPHVAAVHDLSGMGRCSLAIILPVLSAMGCRCSPLLTAWLSASTIYPPAEEFVVRELTEEMEKTVRHWARLRPSFDAIYTGFVGSERQLGVAEDVIRRFRGEGTLVLVDPVMADHGRVYRTYTPEMCREMTALARLADVITPNLTEAALLLSEPLDAAPDSEAGLREWLERLSLNGRRSVILTGVHPRLRHVGCACLDRDTGEVDFPAVREEPAQFPGTGDLFASVTLGALLTGKALKDAAALAVRFVGRCAGLTLDLGTPLEEGVQFESLLGELMGA